MSDEITPIDAGNDVLGREAAGPPDLFASRWIDLPEGVAALDPSALAPGFRAAGTACGIKQSGKPDLALLINDGSQRASAARFTVSSAPAPPVQVCRKHSDLGALKAIIVNSGNANAATGGRGFDNAVFMQGAGAAASGASELQVAVASTGVIGQQLDTSLIARGTADLSSKLTAENSLSFATAILTTDAFVKSLAVTVELAGGTVTISAQAKGAGMIAPNHATMLAFVQTDAQLSADQCDRLLGHALTATMDRVTVDAQLSTNDSVFLMSSGAAGVSPQGELDERRLQHALDTALMALALGLVRDGEGARRIARVQVSADNSHLAERVARAVADSPLVKTALHGGDPNWGRILQAVGMAIGTGEEVAVDIAIEGVAVCNASAAVRFDEDDLAKRVQVDEVEYLVTLPGGGASAEIYFSDLSHEYVTINADYRT
jgi:glutamate N-acetyltransferase/amino-acid N-acetyltransferase